MTYVLGVDPGVVSGWCLFGDGKPLEWGQTGKAGTRTTGADVADVLGNEPFRLGALNSKGSFVVPKCVLAIEGQYLPDAAGKGQRHRMQAVSTLITSRMAGIWMGVCQAHGLEMFNADGIGPTTWRSAVWGGRWTQKQAKLNAVEMAASAWGIRVLKSHHHTAEAMWIASYAWTELKGRE